MTVLWLDHTNCPAWVLQSLHVVVSTWSHWAAPLGVFKGHQTSFLWWETDRKLPSSSLVTNHIASHRPANTRFYNGLWRTHTRASNEPPRSLKLYKHGERPSYRVLQNNWQTLAAYNWDIIWSFLSVFGLFWLSNMGDFSLWYSLGIGMKKKLKNFTLKKG